MEDAVDAAIYISEESQRVETLVLLFSLYTGTVRHHLLHRVPLPECVRILAIPHLLSYDSSWTALVIMKSDSILADMWLHQSVIACT